MNFLRIVLSVFVCFFFCVHGQAQGTIEVEGEVTTPLILTSADLDKLPGATVRARDKDEKEHVYGGVALVEILRQAGVTLGGQLRGENLVKYILVSAADGYKVVFALPEIDPDFVGQTILLAYTVDGKPLPAGEGPFRLVVPNEKKHARWIREIVSIRIGFVK
jgi:DMSO/TMAO reductase YedYZ molybdopterin-dependent catalytic subunit